MTYRKTMKQRLLCVAFLGVALGAHAQAADRATLARARALYNEGRYDEAIEIAGPMKGTPPDASAAALVVGRAHLERFRMLGNPADLDAAREALQAVDVSALPSGDDTELLIGLAETLFLEESFGAAAELFGTLLERSPEPAVTGRERLLDWWAVSLDREAGRREPDARPAVYALILERMERELGRNPGSATAAYWAVAGARLTGAFDRAWDLAVAAWVRAPLARDRAVPLRNDLDRLVSEALIPERAYHLAGIHEQEAAQTALREEWGSVKARWP
jgi:hypothetical protein